MRRTHYLKKKQLQSIEVMSYLPALQIILEDSCGHIVSCLSHFKQITEANPLQIRILNDATSII